MKVLASTLVLGGFAAVFVFHPLAPTLPHASIDPSAASGPRRRPKHMRDSPSRLLAPVEKTGSYRLARLKSA